MMESSHFKKCQIEIYFFLFPSLQSFALFFFSIVTKSTCVSVSPPLLLSPLPLHILLSRLRRNVCQWSAQTSVMTSAAVETQIFLQEKEGADIGGGVMGQFTGMVTRCWALWKRNVYGRCMKVKGVTPVYYGHAVCDSGAE